MRIQGATARRLRNAPISGQEFPLRDLTWATRRRMLRTPRKLPRDEGGMYA